MITTDTGAKKIENSDNWRLIFDAHNDSVDAEDKIVPEMAPIVNGNKSTVGAAIGEYVLVRNSSITGITDGAYTAAKAIPANTTIDSTYLTAVGTGGALNALNSKITPVAITPTVNDTYCTLLSNNCFKVGRLVVINLRITGKTAYSGAFSVVTNLPLPVHNDVSDSTGVVRVVSNSDIACNIDGQGRLRTTSASSWTKDTNYTLSAVYIEDA